MLRHPQTPRTSGRLPPGKNLSGGAMPLSSGSPVPALSVFRPAHRTSSTGSPVLPPHFHSGPDLRQFRTGTVQQRPSSASGISLFRTRRMRHCALLFSASETGRRLPQNHHFLLCSRIAFPLRSAALLRRQVFRISNSGKPSIRLPPVFRRSHRSFRLGSASLDSCFSSFLSPRAGCGSRGDPACDPAGGRGKRSVLCRQLFPSVHRFFLRPARRDYRTLGNSFLPSFTCLLDRVLRTVRSRGGLVLHLFCRKKFCYNLLQQNK